MTGKRLTYFFDSYFLMIDYDESLEEIVSEYIEKENEELVNETINEIAEVVDNNNKAILDYLVENCITFSTDKEEFEEFINEISEAFKSIKK